MENYESILKFNNYKVNVITFERNKKFEESQKSIPVQFSLKKHVEKKNNNMEVRLLLIIFEDADENNYPFEMQIDIEGYFVVGDNKDNFDFEPNAIAILYPYLRAIVSTYTASANIQPLVLPAINVLKMLEQEKE